MIAIFSLFLTLATTVMSTVDSGTMIVQIRELESDEGTIQLALFEGEEGFLKDEAAVLAKTFSLEGHSGVFEAELKDLPFGRYALAIFHDINNNQKLDTNLLGIPTEPYAFSRNPDLKWRGPRFEEAAFDFSEDGQEVSVILKRWKER